MIQLHCNKECAQRQQDGEDENVWFEEASQSLWCSA
jgi:hypothetical protein